MVGEWSDIRTPALLCGQFSGSRVGRAGSPGERMTA
jgi:hypothetical protein